MPPNHPPASPAGPAARFAPCRRMNCVSTTDPRPRYHSEPIAFGGPPAEAWRRLLEVVRSMPRVRIVREEEGYLHAEFRSLVFRFVDDVELALDPEARRIHFRSASRLGRRDFGVNRKRMEGIRSAFQAAMT